MHPIPTPAPRPPDALTRFSQLIGRVIPDAMSTAVGMLLLLTLGALAIGNSGTAVMDAFYRGLWMLLPFTMQMALILVLSSTLGAAPVFKGAVARLSRLPRTHGQVFALACLVVACLAYLYWGLAVALGPLVSIYFAREAERKGIEVDFPFLLATTAAAGSIWQFGLSASAPLLMNTPGHFLEKQTGLVPLSTTIWARPTFVFIVTFFLAVIVAARFLNPRRPQALSQFPDAFALAEPLLVTAEAEPMDHSAPVATLSDRVERSSVPVAILVAALAAWVYYHFAVKGLGLDLNSLNTILFGLALLVHRNVANFNRALQAAILSCWPIVVMHHLYGGVAGLAPVHDPRDHDQRAARDGVYPVHLSVLHRADFDGGGLLRTLERRPMGHSGLCDRHGRDGRRRLGPTRPPVAVDRRSDGESVDAVLGGGRRGDRPDRFPAVHRLPVCLRGDLVRAGRARLHVVPGVRRRHRLRPGPDVIDRPRLEDRRADCEGTCADCYDSRVH